MHSKVALTVSCSSVRANPEAVTTSKGSHRAHILHLLGPERLPFHQVLPQKVHVQIQAQAGTRGNPELALAGILKGEVNAAAKVDQFIDKQLQKYSHGTVRNYLFGVKKWFELNDVKIDWSKIEFPTSTEISETDRSPSKEELKAVLNHASGSRDRATILTLTSSGLRLGTLLSLVVGDVNFDYPDVAAIKVERRRGRKFIGKRRGSQGKVFYTFVTPEAKDALKKY